MFLLPETVFPDLFRLAHFSVTKTWHLSSLALL